MITKADALIKSYNGINALDNLSLEIPEGSVGLLGPNGAGKSTFIRVLLGLVRPTSGAVEIFNQQVNVNNFEVRASIGYMPEHDCLIPQMDAVTFVSYMARMSGLPKADAMQRTHRVLYYVGIGDERYRKISSYSTGMKQKVKLAQAIVHDPELLLLDEPTIGLDPIGREEMLSLIKDISSNDKNILFSSHILPDIERTCKHVIILNRGRKVAQGPLDELIGKTENIYRVRIKGDQTKFISSLQAIGAEPVQNDRELIVRFKTDDGHIRLFSIANETGVQIRSIRRGNASLEDVFLEYVIQKSDNKTPSGGS